MKFKEFNTANIYILISIVVGWIIVAFKIEPFLQYHFQQIGFLTTSNFFKSFLSKPGGIADYISIFLSQFFAFNYFGSLIIVAIASVQGLIILNISKRLSKIPAFRFLFFTIVFLFGILVLSDYRYPYYASIRLLFAFIFTWLYTILNQKFSKPGYFLWPVFAILLFYLASGAALMVFALSSVIVLLITQKGTLQFIATPLIIILAIVIPYLGYLFIFSPVLPNLYRIVEVKPPQMLAYSVNYELVIYYLILPAILLSLIFINRWQKKEIVVLSGKAKRPKHINKFYQKSTFILSSQLVAVFLIGFLLFSTSFNYERKKFVYLEYYAETEQWEEIVEKAYEFEKYDFRVNFYLNRAYSNLGLLPEKLFEYPQLLGSKGLFFDTSLLNGSFTMPLSDLYFDLGFMSEALHWAFEAQTLLPDSPRILKRLVMIYLVNENYQLADKFLKVLNQNALHRGWVQKYSKYISNPALADNDKTIAEKRKFSPQKRAISTHPFDNLKLLFATNKKNRMAFDYLIAHSILDMNYDDFIRYVKGYRFYGIQTLPDSWAQMLSMDILRNKSMPDFADGNTVSQDCLNRFTELNQIIKQYNGDKNAAHEAIKRNFEKTYWYYWMYLNPEITNVLNNITRIE